MIGSAAIQLIYNFENKMLTATSSGFKENVRDLEFIVTDIELKVQTPRACCFSQFKKLG